MTARQRELFRHALLRVLAANGGPHGLSAETLRHFLPAEGFPDAHADDITAELLYFEGKGFAFRAPKAMSAEVITWLATDAGRQMAGR